MNKTPVKGKWPSVPRYPVNEWLGKYQSWWLTMRGRKSYRRRMDMLDRFFRHFQAYKGIEYFTMSHVTDYFLWRLQMNKLQTVLLDMYAVRAFWKWMIEDRGLPLFNPVRPAAMKHIKEEARKREEAAVLAGQVE